MTQRFYTVGHSDGSMDKLVMTLRQHEIQTVVDIRTVPGSKHVPQFNRDVLESALPPKGFAYRFRGQTLGGHPDDPELYRADFRVDFAKLEAQPEFTRAVDALLDEDLMAPALLCKEADPFKCPRFFLLGRILTARGVEVLHIDYESGVAEPHRDAEQRMLEQIGGSGLLSLFDSREQEIAAAYARLQFEYDHRAPWRKKGR